MIDATADIVIPESNRWADFMWPDWVHADVRELIERFWAEEHGRGPRAWAENATQPYTNETPTGAIVRMWTDRSGPGSAPREGRYIHLWNNIGRLLLDEGQCVYASGLATDESIAAERERRVKLVEKCERELTRLRERLAALDATEQGA